MDESTAFPFIKVPLTAQDLIVEKFIEDCEFKDRKQLLLTSTYCNWLVHRARSKPIRIYVVRFEDNNIILRTDSEVLTFKSTDEISEFLDMVKITHFIGSFEYYQDSTYGFLSDLRNVWINAMENVLVIGVIITPDTFDLLVQLLPRLLSLQFLAIYHYDEPEHVSMILNCFQKLPTLCLETNQMDDEVLDMIASKTSLSNPLPGLFSTLTDKLTIGCVESFLKTATFQRNFILKIQMKTTTDEFEQMLGRIGKFNKIPSDEDVDEHSHGYQIKSGVKVKENPKDSYLFVIFLTLC